MATLPPDKSRIEAPEVSHFFESFKVEVKTPSTPGPNTWREFKPAGWDVVVEMPGYVRHQATRKKQLGVEFDQQVMRSGDKTETFLCARAIYAPGTHSGADLRKQLEAAMREMVRAVGGKRTSLRAIKAGRVEGREARVDLPKQKQSAIVRLFLVGDYGYSLVYSGPKGKVDSRRSKRFLDSFVLVGR